MKKNFKQKMSLNSSRRFRRSAGEAKKQKKRKGKGRGGRGVGPPHDPPAISQKRAMIGRTRKKSTA